MTIHDVSVRRIVFAGALILGTVALVVGVIVAELSSWDVPFDGARSAAHVLGFEGPALESAPQPDLRRYRAEKQALLEKTGWVDRSAGIARIPIEAAMALMSAHGTRAAPTDEAQEPAPDAAKPDAHAMPGIDGQKPPPVLRDAHRASEPQR